MSNLRMTEAQVAAHQAMVGKARTIELTNKRDKPTEIKPAKYRNQKVTDKEGITHDSKKEAKRWRELRAMLRAGEIFALARQVEFRLPGAVLYKADFVYFTDLKNMVMVTEDAKGFRTKIFIMKKKQMKEIYGIDVKET